MKIKNGIIFDSWILKENKNIHENVKVIFYYFVPYILLFLMFFLNNYLEDEWWSHVFYLVIYLNYSIILTLIVFYKTYFKKLKKLSLFLMISTHLIYLSWTSIYLVITIMYAISG